MKQPNIILINCDDLGYGDLACYGSNTHPTPHLNRLAAEGMRFTDFCMASSVCSPSRASMLTGCFPNRIGFGMPGGHRVLFPGDGEGLNPDETTIATLLRSAGYATKMVGKWHCGDQPEFLPTRHGFDSYYGLPFSNDMGRQRGRPANPPLPLLLNEEVLEEQPDQAALTYRYLDESLRFLRSNQDRPFFLYLAHMYVHLPIYAPNHFLEQADGDPYAAGVAFVDWSTGVIMNELKMLGLDDDTLIVFTSDNGSRAKPPSGGSNGALRGAKGEIWEGGCRVPGIFRWPGRIAPGSVYNQSTLSIDLYKTFAGLAGVEPPSDRMIDGGDLRKVLLDSPDAATGRDTFPYYFGNHLCAVRQSSWKLHIRSPDGSSMQELYDLSGDIAETQDLYNAHPNKVGELMELVGHYRKTLGDGETLGSETRPIGKVDNPAPLTSYNPDTPYFLHEYDLDHIG